MAPDEHVTSDLRKWVRTALKQAGLPSNPAMLDDLMDRIAQSIETFRAESAAMATISESREALRTVFMLLVNDEPSPVHIRKTFGELPAPAARWIARRATVIWPRLTKIAFSAAAFRNWLATADSEELVRVLRALVSEGGTCVEGRSDDRPARMHFEPVIMGTSRGGKEGTQPVGRPPKQVYDDLVMNLALDWLHATERMPVLKRSESKGFPGLVHRVFDEFGIEGAEPALRRYIDRVRHASRADPGKRQPS